MNVQALLDDPEALQDSYLYGTDLERAASAGCVHVVRSLLGSGVDPNGRKAQVLNGNKMIFGDSPLLGLAEASYYLPTEAVVEIANLLLAAGADVHARDGYGMQPLHRASDSSRFRQHLDTEITQASLALAEILLAHGADPNALDSDDFAPLHRVTLGRFQFKMCRKIAVALLNAGADPNMVNVVGARPKGMLALQAEIRQAHLDQVLSGSAPAPASRRL